MPRGRAPIGVPDARNGEGAGCFRAVMPPKRIDQRSSRSFILASRPAIIPDMPIFGSDGGLVGTVERVSGVRIVLKRTGVSDADQHFIPLAWVASVSDRVTLDCPAADARPPSATTSQSARQSRRSVGPLLWGGVGIAAVGLLYGGATVFLRGKPAAPPAVAPSTVLSPKPVMVAAPPTPLPIATPAPEVPLAKAATVAEFLNSDDPVPQRFSLDTVDFAPGSDSLDGAAIKAVDAIAGVMTTHLNTKIKLAAAAEGGALALRRAMAVRAELIARGVAPYRIAAGPSRERTHAVRSGVDMVVLAK